MKILALHGLVGHCMQIWVLGQACTDLSAQSPLASGLLVVIYCTLNCSRPKGDIQSERE